MSKWCAGNLTHPPAGPSRAHPQLCVDALGQITAVASGNLVFSQHVVNFADVPFYDVDNIAGGDTPYLASDALWYSRNLGSDEQTMIRVRDGGQERSPKGSMVSTVLSAHACYAGSENQPPRFVRDLDTVPRVNGYVKDDPRRFEVVCACVCVCPVRRRMCRQLRCVSA
jgi:hypothetical protein